MPGPASETATTTSAAFGRGIDDDLTAGRRELHGVVEHVGEDQVGQPLRASNGQRERRRRMNGDRDAPSLGLRRRAAGPRRRAEARAARCPRRRRDPARRPAGPGSGALSSGSRAVRPCRDTSASVSSYSAVSRWRRSVTSSSVRRRESGDWSSWAASAVKRRWISKLSSIRPSMSLRVSTSRPISSCCPGRGRRSRRLPSPISRARLTMRSIGRSARRVSSTPINPTPTRMRRPSPVKSSRAERSTA